MVGPWELKMREESEAKTWVLLGPVRKFFIVDLTLSHIKNKTWINESERIRVRHVGNTESSINSKK